MLFACCDKYYMFPYMTSRKIMIMSEVIIEPDKILCNSREVGNWQHSTIPTCLPPSFITSKPWMVGSLPYLWEADIHPCSQLPRVNQQQPAIRTVELYREPLSRKQICSTKNSQPQHCERQESGRKSWPRSQFLSENTGCHKIQAMASDKLASLYSELVTSYSTGLWPAGKWPSSKA